MFNSQILDVAIGVIFVYLLLSLICSAANEGLEAILKNRASFLERGLRELLTNCASPSNSPDLLEALYNHPLIFSLFKDNYSKADPQAGWLKRALRWLSSSRKLPSYIPAQLFGLAMMDLYNQGLLQGKVGDAVETLMKAAKRDQAKAQKSVEDWYNAAMDRVSGWYKRRAQAFILLSGVFVAIALNADSITLVKRLSTDTSLRESLVASATEYAKASATASPSPTPSASKTQTSAQPTESSETRGPKAKAASSLLSSVASPSPSQSRSSSLSPSPSVSPSPAAATVATQSSLSTKTAAKPTPSPSACTSEPDSAECKYEKSLEQLKSLGLPLGWDSSGDPRRIWPGWHWKHPGGWWHQVYWHGFGWLLTALAISLGAPFWFDMLNKFIVVRSTVKPSEKSPEEKSKD
jgi:hypothetical protein